ncbi:hypothetical protein BGZ83_006840 [Gryganskiella cystojenkinii]|nr:hypothetical protein BGZ83_006840 [Gryganskiella cystojenkinii]
MIDFLPYITPRADPTLTPIDFSVAVDDWNESLSKVLKLNTNAFWSELFLNNTLGNFLNTFLGDYAAFRGNKDTLWVMELQEVVRRVFVLYHRLSETIASPEALAATEAVLTSDQQDQDSDQQHEVDADPGSALMDRGLVSTSVLMDLANIYHCSDPDTVSKMVSNLLQHTPGLISDFRSSTNTVVKIIRRVQKKFERGGNGGGAGKGKGKGAPDITASPSPSSLSSSPALPEINYETVTETMLYAHALLDLSFALDALSAASPVLALELQRDDEFLQCLFECYSYTLPILTRILIESEELGADLKAQSVLEFLRLRMLSIVYNILEGIYKQHMEDSASTETADQDRAEAEANLTDSLCDLIVELYEQAPLLEHMRPMYDAPMVMDLEIQLDLSNRLSKMIESAFQGENDRISHWVETLHGLRDFNPATRGFLYDQAMQKSEKVARKISSSPYYDQESHFSNSTISSESSAPQIVVAPMSAVQEEDYVKRTMLISQLQDLFPELGDGFLEACLIAFQDDPETVTMKLLEEDLPSELALMERTKARSLPHRVESTPMSMALVKSSTHEPEVEQDVLATRRNIFDGDEFDVFSGNVVDKSKMSRGKRGPEDAAVVLDDKSFVTEHKGAILQALDNMYDDEYDDTYDSMGLNNTGADFKLVDDIDANADDSATKHTIGRAQMQIDPSIEHEEVLISTYTGQKEVFNRSAEARRSKQRQHLRQLTKMSDEQLEGWAIMFDRNPRKAVIAQKYEYSGQQNELAEAEPIDKRRGGRMPFVDKSATQPQQQRQQQSKQDQSQSKKKTSPATGGKQQGPAQQQRSGQGQNQAEGQQGKGQDQTQPKSTPANKPNPNAGEKAKNERQKSSKANHNRRNAHAKKFASINP